MEDEGVGMEMEMARSGAHRAVCACCAVPIQVRKVFENYGSIRRGSPGPIKNTCEKDNPSGQAEALRQ